MLDFIAAIAWPLVVLILVVAFRRQIQAFARALVTAQKAKASIAGVTFEWEQIAEAAERELVKADGPATSALAQVEGELPAPPGARDSNRERIVAAHRLVRTALEDAARVYAEDDVRRIETLDLVTMLAARGIVAHQVTYGVQVLDDLYRAFLSGSGQPTDANTESFLDLARTLISKIPGAREG